MTTTIQIVKTGKDSYSFVTTFYNVANGLGYITFSCDDSAFFEYFGGGVVFTKVDLGNFAEAKKLKDDRIEFRINGDVKHSASELAEAQGVSLSEYIGNLIEKSLDEKDKSPNAIQYWDQDGIEFYVPITPFAMVKIINANPQAIAKAIYQNITGQEYHGGDVSVIFPNNQ